MFSLLVGCRRWGKLLCNRLASNLMSSTPCGARTFARSIMRYSFGFHFFKFSKSLLHMCPPVGKKIGKMRIIKKLHGSRIPFSFETILEKLKIINVKVKIQSFPSEKFQEVQEFKKFYKVVLSSSIE